MKRIKDEVYRRAKATYRRVVGAPPGLYDDFNAAHRELLARAGVQAPVIFDVGAHVGESVERFKTLFPRSNMHSFEADSENFAKLRANTAAFSGLTLNNFAAGSAPGRQTFYRNVKSDTSSFNPVNPGSQWAATRSKQHNVSVEQFTAKQCEVELRTIDGYMADNGIARIDILKIDTQGFEDEVLKGCREAIAAGRIHVIETELILGDSYTRSLTFSTIENLLLPFGYKFCALDRGGNMLTWPAMSLNLIYARGDLMPRAGVNDG